MDQLFDVIVVGAGVMGVSSGYFCRKEGLRVLLLEKFAYPHTRGSSHGYSRITRSSYMESGTISKMMKEANFLWKMLEIESNAKLFWPNGALYLEKKPSNKIKEMAKISDEMGYRYSILDGTDIKSRFENVFTNYEDYLGLLDHEGGLLRADLVCSTLFNLFKKMGGEFLDMAEVKSIEPSDGVTTVYCDDGRTFKGKKIVLSVGPWSGKLLEKLSLQLPLTVVASTVTFWPSRDPASVVPSKMPCFVDITNHCYGLPAFEYPGLVKIARLCSTETCDPDLRDVEQIPREKVLEFFKPYLRKHFPKLTTPPAIAERCLTTESLDHLWIIDRHPTYKNIIVLCGFSGHGFKAAPLIGKIASQLVTDSEVNYDLTEFRIDRFNNTSKL